MIRTAVHSSILQSIGYDPIQRMLEVELKGRKVKVYVGVPEELYTELMTAPSMGKFYLSEIKGKYKGGEI
jgi:hypothetical protein